MLSLSNNVSRRLTRKTQQNSLKFSNHFLVWNRTDFTWTAKKLFSVSCMTTYYFIIRHFSITISCRRFTFLPQKRNQGPANYLRQSVLRKKVSDFQLLLLNMPLRYTQPLLLLFLSRILSAGFIKFGSIRTNSFFKSFIESDLKQNA